MENLESLNLPIKATILLENAFGLPILRHVTLKKVEYKENEYSTKKSINAWFIHKGKRKLTGIKFEKCVIGMGWQNIDGAFNNSKQGGFWSFDSEKFDELRNKVNNVFASTEDN